MARGRKVRVNLGEFSIVEFDGGVLLTHVSGRFGFVDYGRVRGLISRWGLERLDKLAGHGGLLTFDVKAGNLYLCLRNGDKETCWDFETMLVYDVCVDELYLAHDKPLLAPLCAAPGWHITISPEV